jgi:hypothetical protein
MKKNMKSRDEEGFMMVGAAIASVVLLILVFAVLRYGQSDATSITRSKVNGNLQSALDAGLERATAMLNSSNNWYDSTTWTGFQSLSWTAYTEINRTTYWVMVLDGAKNVTYSASLLDHSSAKLLTNTGDINLDRTILIRAVDSVTNMTATAQAILHRNDLMQAPIVGGITTSGDDNLDNMNFWSFNSCTGEAPGGCSGTAQGSPAHGGTGSCLPLQTNTTPVAIPTVAVPAGNLPLPPNTAITQAWSIGGSTDVTISTGKYQCASMSFGGNANLYLDTCAGPIEIYVTGNLDQAGGGNIQSGCNPKDPGHPVGGAPAKATVFVSGPIVNLKGTGSYEILLYAPVADVSITGGGNGSFYGAIVGKSFDGGSSNNFDMNFDACLLQGKAVDNYQKPPVVTSSWKLIP